MKMEEFIEKIRTTKFTPTQTGFFDTKVKTNKEHTIQTIYTEKICSKCKRPISNSVTVEFFKPHQLTVFEADLLYVVYCLNKKPADYASYHKCVAGKEFIENIKSIKIKG